MGRPTKPGLDYFRHDVGLMTDPKLIRPRRQYGYLAIVVYLQLLVMAYRDKGYYLEYDDETRDGVIWSIKSEVLQGKYDPDAKTVEEVINCLTACRLFSHDLFERGFITSQRIQEHYYFATAGRTDPDVRWDLWLLSEQRMREISTRNVLLQKFISQSENHSFSNDKPTFCDCESTHSKVKDRKEKDSISTLPIVEQVEKTLERKLNRSNCAAIQKMQDSGMSDVVLLQTAEYAAKNAKGDSAAYFMTVLRERFSRGMLTAADLRTPVEKHKGQTADTADGYLHPGNGQVEEEWVARVKKYQEKKAQEVQQDGGRRE